MRRRGRTIGGMEHNSRIIAVAAEAVLDKRLRTLEDKIAAARVKIGGGPEHQAAVEFHVGAFDVMVRELNRAYADGRSRVDGVAALRSILDNNRQLAAIR
jgi:hypothetical protein